MEVERENHRFINGDNLQATVDYQRVSLTNWLEQNSTHPFTLTPKARQKKQSCKCMTVWPMMLIQLPQKTVTKNTLTPTIAHLDWWSNMIYYDLVWSNCESWSLRGTERALELSYCCLPLLMSHVFQLWKTFVQKKVSEALSEPVKKYMQRLTLW